MAKKKKTVAQKAKEGVICITVGCSNPVMNRGLCNGCYSSAMRLIRAGKVSEKKLLREKRILPATTQKGAFLKSLGV